MSRRRTQIVCRGGLNTVSPDDEVLDGQLIHANNVEQTLRGGYRRIDGYERYDGKGLPSEAKYWKVTCSATSEAIVAGGKLIIGGVTAVATQDHLSGSTLLYLSSPDTISAAASVIYLGNPIATTADPISSNYNSDSAHADSLATAASYWRTLIRSVPGAGDILGCAMYKGDVVAFRDNVSQTECVGYKATGVVSTVERQAIYLKEFNYIDKFGKSVSISDDASVLVIGANYSAEGGASRGAVYVYSQSGGVCTLKQKITVSPLTNYDYFGEWVDISGDGTTLAVGAFGDNTKGTNAGAVYIYTLVSDVWTLQQKLTASDGAASDYFGNSVSISEDGNSVLVGARNEDGAGTNRGAAYVFTRSGTTWTEQQKLTASDAADNDAFGWRVSLSSDSSVAVVGAYLEDGAGTDRGAAYVFTRSGTTWTEQQKLTASDAEDSDAFGYSVAVSGDSNVVVVGARAEAGSGATRGAAYAYTLSGSTWIEQQKIVAVETANNDYFGESVSISSDGSIIVVGAYGSNTDQGAIFLFKRHGVEWEEQEKIVASDATNGDFLGVSCDVTGDGLSIIAGTYSNNEGKAYLIDVIDGYEAISKIEYKEQAALTPDYANSNDDFAKAVAVGGSGQVLAVGSPINDDKEIDSGLVQMYERYGTTWSEADVLYAPNVQLQAEFGSSISITEDGQAMVVGAPAANVLTDEWGFRSQSTASDAASGDNYGTSVSVSSNGNTAIVGASKEDGSGVDRGAAYILIRSGTTWTEQQKLTASDAADYDYFGTSVSISEDGNTAIVGAHWEDGAGTNRGAAYVFTRSGATWTEQQKLTASDAADNDYFGYSVAISSDGNSAIIGAYGRNGAGTSRGGVYIFTRSGTTWTEQQQLTASDAADDDWFGWSVAISDENTMLVGASAENGLGISRGAVYVFARSEVLWHEHQKLAASDAADNDYFGNSVSISLDGNTAIVGSQKADAVYTDAGAAYVFTRSGTTWTEQQKLTAPDAGTSDTFGRSVSVSSDGNTTIVGAIYEDTAGANSGAAYVFTRSGATWTEQQKLTASDAADNDYFGYSVAISSDGNSAIIGATNSDVAASNAGVAEIFSLYAYGQGEANYYTKGELGWGLSETIEEGSIDSDISFGTSVKLSDDGTVMAISAPWKNKNSLAAAGEVLVYVKDSTWVLKSTLTVDTPSAYEMLGYSIDLSKNGDVLVVGQYGKTVSSLVNAGAVLIYTQSQGVWSLDTTIDTPNAEVFGYFGAAVAVSADGNVIAIGAPLEDGLGTNSGRVYIYELVSGAWTLKQTLIMKGSASTGDDTNFGNNVDLNTDGSVLVVKQGTTNRSGKINVFYRENDYWTVHQRISANDTSALGFGYDVSMTPNGDFIVSGTDSSVAPGFANVLMKSGAVLNPGGDYYFDNYNFIGSSGNKNLYGADGKNKGFEYNGTYFKQIRTGMEVDTPDHVAAHKHHLFFSFQASLQHSSLGDPHTWSVITGAAELGIGDNITGLIRTRGGELAVFARNKTFVLYGSSTLDWQLSEFSKDTGAIEGTAQPFSNPIYLDDRGIATLPTVQAHGNFVRNSISESINDIISELRGLSTTSTIVRKKNQYRLFFSTGLALIITIGADGSISILPMQYDDAVKKAVSQEGLSGEEEIYFGSSNGYIYRMDSGVSFDGSAFSSSFRLPRLDFGFPQYKKKLYKAELFLRTEGYTSFDVTPDLEYENTDNPAELPTTLSLSKVSGFWTGQNLSVDKSRRERFDLKGLARAVSLEISCSSDRVFPFTVDTIALDWSFRKKVN